MKTISPFLIRSTMCGRPSSTLLMRSQAMPCSSQEGARAPRRDELKPRAAVRARLGSSRCLSAIAHREERLAGRWRLNVRRFVRARERGAETAADAHHFAGRAHLRAEDRIDVLELEEREDRFLDRVVLQARPRVVAPCSASVLPTMQRAAIFAERHTGRLRHERHRARRARVHFEDVDRFDAVLGRSGSRTACSSVRQRSARAPSA